MAIYDVKYNPSGDYIPGATQIGTLAVAIGQVDYSTGGWYGGVDDSLGYVIYSDTTSTNLSGRSAGSASSIAQALKPTFFRSKGKTDGALLELINRLPGNTQSFANVNDAKVWLNNSGNFGSLDMSSGTSGTSGTSSYIVTIKEVDSNIVMVGSGTLNINDLTLVAGATGPMGSAGIGINSATFILGANGGYFDQYSGILTNPSNFGTGGGNGASTSTGDIVGLVYNGVPPHLLVVPVGYTSGSYLTSSQTFNSQTFTSLGLVAGTYSYTWGTGSNADSITVVVGGTASGGGGGGATGSGSWYFYSDEGNLNAGPPTADGNAIFRINGSPAVETYNPNKANGVNSIYFNLSDSAGVDYTTQFTTLQNSGGTITMTQGANIATYTSVIPGTFFVDSMNGIFVIQTDPATQTVTSASPFVYASPISISFS